MGSRYEKLEKNTPITNFYKRKSLFITGCTGFLGTVLLEKLLFSCLDVKNFFVLMKPKNGVTAEERLQNHLKSEAFRRVRLENPDVIDKIVPVNGDLRAPNLGLDDMDIVMLQENVAIVFHVAADISFDLPLVEAVNTNTKATGKLLEFCRTFIHLEALIYVSTAYCNCRQNGEIIEERVYQTKTSLQSAFYALDTVPENESTIKALIDGRPNRYVYSKALAEQMIENEFSDLPIAIVRPSVITAALSEPATGWVSGFSGGNSVVFLQGLGLLRVWCGDKNAVCDVIPVDLVAKMLIAAAWDVYTNRSNNANKIKVFNYCSGLQNPLTLGQLLETTSYNSRILYKGELSLPPTLAIVKSPIMFAVVFFILHTIPAYILHWTYILFFKKSRMLKLRQKLLKLVHHLNFFASNQFTFIDQNVKELYLKMDVEDQVIFDFNITHVDWNSYLYIYVYGLKNYLSKRIRNL